MLSLKLIPETFRTVQEELFLLGGSVLLGIPSGILFDLMRLFRKLFKHHALTVMLEDILFLLLSSFLLLCYASACSGGIFRFYFVIGWLCGLLLYFCIVSSPVSLLFKQIKQIIKKAKSFFIKTAKK